MESTQLFTLSAILIFFCCLRYVFLFFCVFYLKEGNLGRMIERVRVCVCVCAQSELTYIGLKKSICI